MSASRPPAIRASTDDDPGAAALVGIAEALAAISNGKPGAASAGALIAEGIALSKQFRPATHVQWAQQATAMASFWRAAARHQPRLVRYEVAARHALREMNVTVNRRRE